MTAAEAHAAAEAARLSLVRAENATGFKGVYPSNNVSKPFKARDGRHNYLGSFATAEEAALAVARFLGPAGAAAPSRRKRPAASGAGPSAPPTKRGKQPADDDDDEEYVVKAEAVSDDDDDGPPPPAVGAAGAVLLRAPRRAARRAVGVRPAGRGRLLHPRPRGRVSV